MNESWFNTVKKEYSQLIDIFYGQNITQIICGQCNKIHHNYEMFSNLMIPIDIEANSLIDCMDHYFQDEILNTYDNPWICDVCKSNKQSKKSLIIWKEPDILIISLKRFSENMKKNNKNLIIPEIIELNNYSINKKRAKKYKLLSVSCHVGSMYGGHYISICKKNDKWYIIDDIDIREIKDPDMGTGYLYFYQSI
jgi:ubiquitin C-terminal hydrolase